MWFTLSNSRTLELWGMFCGGANPKRKDTDFYAGRDCSGCRGIRGDQTYDAFQSIGPSPDSKTPF